MKRILIIWLLVIYVLPARGEDAKYPYSSINTALLKNADAVYRLYDCNIQVISGTEILLTEKRVVTVLNSKGYEQGQLAEFSSSLQHIEDVKGTLFDKDGKEVKTMKKRDLVATAVNSYNTADDHKINSFDFHYANYPFTVEYEVKKKLNSFFFTDCIVLQEAHNSAVETASLVLEYPNTMDIKYKLYHITEPVVRSEANGKISLTLLKQNIPAFQTDRLAIKEPFKYPAIAFAANLVTMGDITGSMNTWKDYGKFFYELNKGRDLLPDDIKRTVHSIADTCHTKKQKIDLLYKYLQQNTRYVSVQLGIGGWQTYSSEYVMKNGYGDCKALSNCMKGFLKEAGIPAYEVLVYGSDGNDRLLETEFPADGFNHVILCAADAIDTTWLECTSDDLPAGYLSSFTGNRNALLVTPDGGKILRTPSYGCEENCLVNNVVLEMKPDGSLTGKLHVGEYGSFYDRENALLDHGTKAQKEKVMNAKVVVQNYALTGYQYANDFKGKVPGTTMDITFSGKATLNTSGKRIFFTPVVTHMPAVKAMFEESRTKPFYLRSSYSVVDTTLLSVDASYQLEFLPPDVTMNYPFGTYTYKAVLDKNNVLKVIRFYKQVEGEYAAELYAEYLKFNAGLHEDGLSEQVVFAKKD